MRANVGPGRFGPIYRAAAPGGEDVAIKVFDQGLAPEQARLLAEALARLCRAPLDHPSILSAIAAGVEGELAWVAERWVDGTPLDTVLANAGALPLAEALLRITQVAGALDFAAATGVFHGALHPHDILLSADRALVTGLGFVQALSEAGFDVPLSGAASSPQRRLGLPVTHADDIHALAAITIEMFYGRPLTDRKRLRAVVTPLPGIDHERLRDVLDGSLAEDPGDRPSTALEFAGALQRAVLRIPAQIPVPPPVPVSIPGAGPSVPVRDPRSDSDPDLRADSGPTPQGGPIPDHAAAPALDLPLRTTDLPAVPAIDAESPWELDSAIAPADSSAASESREPAFLDASRGVEPAKPPRQPDPLSAKPVAESPQRISRGESPSDRELAFANLNREAEPEPSQSESGSSAVRASYFGVAVGLAIGILAGFAGGFVVGQRDATPTPISASRAIPRAQRAPAPSPDAPAATSGREFTESAVPPATVGEPEVKSTEGDEPGGSASPTDDTAQGHGPGRVEVVSRPSGAQVFLDGRLVGRTPLLLSPVAAGSHAVRLALPGHQRWVTTVDVEPGAHARVAASLER